MSDIEYTLIDNSDVIKDALEEQIEKGLMAVGMTGETHTKKNCPVDTGRLRNSITFALAGRNANISSYHADFTRYKTSKGKTVIRRENLKTYYYKGKAPNQGGREHSVYIGSNVEYASAVENGTSRMKARPYLRPAIVDHTDEYKNLIKMALST